MTIKKIRMNLTMTIYGHLRKGTNNQAAEKLASSLALGSKMATTVVKKVKQTGEKISKSLKTLERATGDRLPP